LVAYPTAPFRIAAPLSLRRRPQSAPLNDDNLRARIQDTALRRQRLAGLKAPDPTRKPANRPSGSPKGASLKPPQKYRSYAGGNRVGAGWVADGRHQTTSARAPTFIKTAPVSAGVAKAAGRTPAVSPNPLAHPSALVGAARVFFDPFGHPRPRPAVSQPSSTVDTVHARISWQIPVDRLVNCELYHCNRYPVRALCMCGQLLSPSLGWPCSPDLRPGAIGAALGDWRPVPAACRVERGVLGQSAFLDHPI